MERLIGKKILIAGLGKSGTAAFDALFAGGAALYVFDDRDIEKDEPALFEKLKAAASGIYTGGEPVPDESWHCVIMSPGVPASLPFVLRARERGAKVLGELELSWRLGHGLYAAITGTNGKTTTTTLVGEIFSAAGLKNVVAGNIGTPIVSKSTEADDDTWLITEVSSFQLETILDFRPKIAAILNLTPDHLDRHKNMENYAAAKARIFENQEASDVLVYNADDEIVSKLADGARSMKTPFSRVGELERGAYVKDGMIVYSDSGLIEMVVGTEELKIPGGHNLENALAATAISFAAGIDAGVIAQALRAFAGVEHRIELVAEIGGVRFVNDSKGTNPDASIKAIEAIGKDILLIAGGYDKGADFAGYIGAAAGKVKKFLLFGATAEKIRESALAGGFREEDIITAGSMEKAVASGMELAEPGDTVLLSPACASWDMYTNYEERGAEFKSCVAAIKERI